jgi:hypothetical protein
MTVLDVAQFQIFARNYWPRIAGSSRAERAAQDPRLVKADRELVKAAGFTGKARACSENHEVRLSINDM